MFENWAYTRLHLLVPTTWLVIERDNIFAIPKLDSTGINPTAVATVVAKIEVFINIVQAKYKIASSFQF